MRQKVLVIGEVRNKLIRHVSFEAIAAAKKISNGGEVIGTVCGSDGINDLAIEMNRYGADYTIAIENDKLETHTPEGYAQAVMEVIYKVQPDAVLMGHTSLGKDITPKIASKLDAGLISDSINVELDGDDILFTRPIYSGKAFEKKQFSEGILFATIRPNNIRTLTRDESKTGEVEMLDVNISDLRTIVKDIVRKKSEGVDLSEARVIVAGGRGVKSKDGFKPLYELAELLGGAVGASRGACDADYCDYSLQIGQTGKVVTPDLYIACGISGAIQHLAGMSNSKVIVAINKDPDATIFEVADYGIVGDLFDVVPKLINEIKQMGANC